MAEVDETLPEIGSTVSWTWPKGTFASDHPYAQFESEALEGLVTDYYRPSEDEVYLRVEFILEEEDDDGACKQVDCRSKVNLAWLC